MNIQKFSLFRSCSVWFYHVLPCPSPVLLLSCPILPVPFYPMIPILFCPYLPTANANAKCDCDCDCDCPALCCCLSLLHRCLYAAICILSDTQTLNPGKSRCNPKRPRRFYLRTGLKLPEPSPSTPHTPTYSHLTQRLPKTLEIMDMAMAIDLYNPDFVLSLSSSSFPQPAKPKPKPKFPSSR